MNFARLLRGNRFAHQEAHEDLTRAARYWLPNARDEMEVRELVKRWTEEARRYAEGVR